MKMPICETGIFLAGTNKRRSGELLPGSSFVDFKEFRAEN